MRVLTVVGNRPQFVKAAAVSHRLRAVGSTRCSSTPASTTTTRSRACSSTSSALPRPEHRFDLGGGSNTAQTARMLTELAPLLASEAPDVVLVYGDTNSTLAGALAAAQAGVPVAHVEAGMRSYDRSHAGGAQPRADRPRVLAAAVLVAGGRVDAARPSRSSARSCWSAT